MLLGIVVHSLEHTFVFLSNFSNQSLIHLITGSLWLLTLHQNECGENAFGTNCCWKSGWTLPIMLLTVLCVVSRDEIMLECTNIYVHETDHKNNKKLKEE